MNHLSTKSAARPTLIYPFKRGFSPKPGAPFEIAEGVFWLRMPLPISLDHINLWLLKDGEQWVIVDSGFDDPVCKEVWETVFNTFISPQRVSRIIVTHFHPDHIGLAAWLAQRCECKIHITQGELDRYRTMVEREPNVIGQDVIEFVSGLGFTPKQQENYVKFFKVDDKPPDTRVQRETCEIVQESDRIEIGEHYWQVVMGNGHSPEHACLYCGDLNLLISGDQALPRISSNVSVYYGDENADPLKDWLHSCAKLRDGLPSKTLVLPSHQEPFVGLDLRMQQLIDDHQAQLNKLRTRMDRPMTAKQATTVLFDRELSQVDVLLATGETLAHINYLVHQGEASKTKESGSATLFEIVKQK